MSIERDRVRLATVDPRLAAAYLKISADFVKAFYGSSLAVTSAGSYRTPAAQAQAHAEGSSGYDGTTAFSKHQFYPSQALDFAVLDPRAATGYVQNGSDPRYAWVGTRFEAEGFKWGHRFKKRSDDDHVEIEGPEPSASDVTNGFSAWKAGQGATVRA